VLGGGHGNGPGHVPRLQRERALGLVHSPVAVAGYPRPWHTFGPTPRALVGRSGAVRNPRSLLVVADWLSCILCARRTGIVTHESQTKHKLALASGPLVLDPFNFQFRLFYRFLLISLRWGGKGPSSRLRVHPLHGPPAARRIIDPKSRPRRAPCRRLRVRPPRGAGARAGRDVGKSIFLTQSPPEPLPAAHRHAGAPRNPFRCVGPLRCTKKGLTATCRPVR